MKRTLYFNDARHYYLFVFEPPMRLEDAWVPVDEVAGTAVDTFVYGVSRADGLFYPSRVGLQFGADRQPFQHAYEWRAWEDMQSLIQQGLDPLSVLIDRAHEKNLDFIASLRMGSYGGITPAHMLENGGRGFVHPEVRNHQFAVLKELATQYPVQGLELDFAASPGGCPFWLRPEDATEYTPVMTDFLRQTADMVRSRPGSPGLIGARIYPTEELNLKTGLDIHTWINEGLVDFLIPVIYADFVLDANMPIEWLTRAAQKKSIAIYGMLQPYAQDESRRFHTRKTATPAMIAAAASNFWAAGVDGLYTWFLPWPLGSAERRILTDIGHPDQVQEADKHYFLRRNSEATQGHGYPAALPLEIPTTSLDQHHRISFSIADEPQNPRIQRIEMKLGISNLVSADQLDIRLNSTALLPTSRSPINPIAPYEGQWLAYTLSSTHLKKGQNLLELALLERPPGLKGSITVEDIEIQIEYGLFPTFYG